MISLVHLALEEGSSVDTTKFCRIDWNPSDIYVIELGIWVQIAGVNLRVRSDDKNIITIHIPKLTPEDAWRGMVSNRRLRLVQTNTPTHTKDPTNLLPTFIFMPPTTLERRRLQIEIGSSTEGR